jgi:predicted type IV restriction endonuclease
MELSTIIVRVRQGLTSRRYGSEAAVREAIVPPVLRALGWDDLDPDRVAREYPLGGRRVDYALSAFGARPALFIEVKKPGESVAGVEKQLFEYAFHEGIPFAVLTNGQEWSFYLPAGQGAYDERLLYKLDVAERDPTEAVEQLTRYLGFERVRSGQALDDGLHKTRVIRNALPEAWAQLLDGPGEVLVSLLAERVTTLCGFPPDPDLIAQFLGDTYRTAPRSVADAKLAARPPSPTPAVPSAGPVASTAPRVAAVPPTASGAVASRLEPMDAAPTTLRYRLLGQDRTARSGNDLVLHVLRTLAERDPGFLERFAPEARGRRRNHVAQRPEDVYPGKPQLLKFVVKVAPGWYFGTNVSNRDKAKLLEAACRVSGLTSGVDLVYSLPNAKA